MKLTHYERLGETGKHRTPHLDLSREEFGGKASEQGAVGRRQGSAGGEVAYRNLRKIRCGGDLESAGCQRPDGQLGFVLLVRARGGRDSALRGLEDPDRSEPSARGRPRASRLRDDFRTIDRARARDRRTSAGGLRLALPLPRGPLR